MKYISYFLFIIGALIVFIGMTNIIKKPAAHIPAVEEGVIDLTDMEDLEEPIIKLDGTWEFYWKTFTHSETEQDGSPTEKMFIRVPNSWEDAGIDAAKISNMGYGTYKLTLLLPEQYRDKTFGLYIPSVATAYKLWINDELLISNGEIATTDKKMTPVNYARAAYFQPKDTTINVVFEVANFSQRKAGLWEPIQFGEASKIALLKEKSIALQLLVVGSLVIMGIYNIFVYVLRRSLTYSMFLGILCLLFAMRTLLVGETFFINLFPDFPWEVQVKLEYLPIIFGLPLLVKYVNGLYEEEKFPIFERAVIILAVIFAVFVLVTPAVIYTKYLVMFLVVIPITLVYFGYIFINAYVAKQPASLFTLIGFTIFIVSAMNDSLYYLDFTNNGTYLSSGFLFFLLSQTFVHAIQFSEAHRQIEALSFELMETNRSLEIKVEERTHQLSQLYSKLRASELERKNLMSDLAHEISKPLTLIKGYSEAMLDDKLDPEKDYLQIIYHNANISERLIHDLSELSKLETRQMQLIFQKINTQKFPSNIYQYHRWTVENQRKKFVWINRETWLEALPEETYIYIDPDRINQVFINIIENALYHAEEGHHIFMEVEWNSSKAEKLDFALDEVATALEAGESFEWIKNGDMIIKIIDEGKGIAEADLPFVFNRLYRGTNQKEGVISRGLGLAISKELIEMHGGKIWLESKLGEGSTFYISFPTFRS